MRETKRRLHVGKTEHFKALTQIGHASALICRYSRVGKKKNYCFLPVLGLLQKIEQKYDF